MLFYIQNECTKRCAEATQSYGLRWQWNFGTSWCVDINGTILFQHQFKHHDMSCVRTGIICNAHISELSIGNGTRTTGTGGLVLLIWITCKWSFEIRNHMNLICICMFAVCKINPSCAQIQKYSQIMIPQSGAIDSFGNQIDKHTNVNSKQS